MTAVYLVDAWRTPFAKAGGELAEVSPQELTKQVISPVLRRLPTLPSLQDVIMGNVLNGRGNLARYGLLAAGLPVEIPGLTLDRQCASGMEAVGIAFERARQDAEPVSFLAGGVESMSQAPYLMARPSMAWDRRPPQFLDVPLSPPELGDPTMIETAETVIAEASISRREQDDFALLSHRRAVEAAASGRFAQEIIPLEIAGRQGLRTVSSDVGPRANTDAEKLARLHPVLGSSATVTAGNASGIADGAAVTVVMNQAALDKAGVIPLARILGIARVGVDPARMGLGPVPAVRRLLGAHQLSVSDIEHWEINEAFAGQILAVLRQLDIPTNNINRQGGAIALGHPLGASGARLVGHVGRTVAATGRPGTFGVAALCVGGGMGVAMLVQSCH